jgi:hypothetical protein
MVTDSNEVQLSQEDLNDLRIAKSKLEYPGLTARITDLIGQPIEEGFKLLPKNINKKIGEITQTALLKGLEFAVLTMGESEKKSSQDWLHKLLIASSGIAGGFAGFSSLSLELPISTCIILRSIADIARSEGHNIRQLEVQLSCLEILALGGTKKKHDPVNSGYWAVRSMLAKSVSEAAAFIAERGFAEKGAPPLLRLIASIASRFSVVITEEVAAKAIPIVGAVAGGTINILFINHFQEMARGHFIVKRLENKYGTDLIEKMYKEMVVYSSAK